MVFLSHPFLRGVYSLSRCFCFTECILIWKLSNFPCLWALSRPLTIMALRALPPPEIAGQKKGVVSHHVSLNKARYWTPISGGGSFDGGSSDSLKLVLRFLIWKTSISMYQNLSVLHKVSRCINSCIYRDVPPLPVRVSKWRFLRIPY